MDNKELITIKEIKVIKEVPTAVKKYIPKEDIEEMFKEVSKN